MKIIITGHRQHGKNTICEMLPEEFSAVSSSEKANELIVFDTLKDIYGYATPQECYDDRDNHRVEWFDIICGYNKDDLSRLGTIIFRECNVYNGIRNKLELDALRDKKEFDYLIWVDASARMPIETSDSMTVTKADADYILDNNSGKASLIYEVEAMMRWLYSQDLPA